MKIKVYINCEAGPISEAEAKSLAGLQKYFENYELSDHLIDCSHQGWFYAAGVGVARLGSEIIRLTAGTRVGEPGVDVDTPVYPLERLDCTIYPWVPPGETWPGARENGVTYHESWRIDFRATKPLPPDGSEVKPGLYALDNLYVWMSGGLYHSAKSDGLVLVYQVLSPVPGRSGNREELPAAEFHRFKLLFDTSRPGLRTQFWPNIPAP